MERSLTQPGALLRAFDKKEYARAFIGGAIRVGLLSGYRAIEGRRRDETEGTVSIAWSGPQNPVYCEGLSGNNYYILSASDPTTERRVLIERFGTHVVRINNPTELLKRIETAWQANSLACGGVRSRCVIEPVVYNKGALLDATPGLQFPANYYYSQKPKSPFEVENEFRYILTCTADVLKLRRLIGGELVFEKHLTLKLPDCSDICSLAYHRSEALCG
jgi:hypothetical protein